VRVDTKARLSGRPVARVLQRGRNWASSQYARGSTGLLGHRTPLGVQGADRQNVINVHGTGEFPFELGMKNAVAGEGFHLVTATRRSIA